MLGTLSLVDKKWIFSTLNKVTSWPSSLTPEEAKRNAMNRFREIMKELLDALPTT